MSIMEKALRCGADCSCSAVARSDGAKKRCSNNKASDGGCVMSPNFLPRLAGAVAWGTEPEGDRCVAVY